MNEQQIFVFRVINCINKNHLVNISSDFIHFLPVLFRINMVSEHSMFDNSKLVYFVDYFVALSRHAITKAHYLVVFRHLSKKIVCVRSDTDVVFVPSVSSSCLRLITEDSNKINNKSILVLCALDDKRSRCSRKKRNDVLCLNSMNIKGKEGKKSIEKSFDWAWRISIYNFEILFWEKWINLANLDD